MPVKIRKVNPRDADAVIGLISSVWESSYSGLLKNETIASFSARWLNRDILLAQLQAPDTLFILAEDETGLAGAATFVGNGPGEIYLARLYVKQDRQGKGLGRSLFNEGISHFSPVKAVRLEVIDGNSQAVSFYERLGFKTYGRKIEKLGGEEVTLLLMKADL